MQYLGFLISGCMNQLVLHISIVTKVATIEHDGGESHGSWGLDVNLMQDKVKRKVGKSRSQP